MNLESSRIRLALVLLALLSSTPVRSQVKSDFDDRLDKATSAFERGATEEATQAFGTLAAEHPERPEPYWYLGVLAFRAGDYQKATAAFSDLTSRQPERGAGWVMLGLSEFRIKRYEDALLHIEQGRFLGDIADEQLNQSAAVVQAMLCTRIGRFDVALAVLSELAVSGVKTPTVIATFGLAALNRAQLLDEVRKDDQRMVMEVGDTAWAIGAKQTELSIHQAEALLKRYAQQAGLHYILGTALLRNNWERAEKEFRLELSQNPEHYSANVVLAAELMERNRYADAMAPARKAVSLRANDFVSHTLLGRALLGTGSVGEAIAHLEESVSLEPRNPNARYSLSTAYARAGRKTEAQQEREAFAALQTKAGTRQ